MSLGTELRAGGPLPEAQAQLRETVTLLGWQQVLAEAGRHRLTLRTAATCLTVRRVAEAHRQRGLYP